MAVEHTVTTPVERPRESHDVLFQDELAILLRVSRATIERRRRLLIDELPPTHQSHGLSAQLSFVGPLKGRRFRGDAR
jgi:hypothetical protein